jgi:hypothetical protein
VARKKEQRIRWRERREQRDEEHRLCEQQGLSPPATSEYSSSGEGEEEESDGPPERWEPAPPSPRAAEPAEERAPRAGTGAPATRQSTEGTAPVVVAPARVAEAFGSAAVAASAATTASAEPSRKRKQGFSTLR